MITIKAEKREKSGTGESLRAQGLIPAVFYGKTKEATAITVNAKDFDKVRAEAGESTVITIEVAGGDTVDALIHDIQFDPVSQRVVHVDFYVFDKNTKVEVEVPLNFVGTSPAVKDLGGILVKVLYDIEIEALPTNLPHEIQVDISSLTDFDKVIAVKDLALPEGVTATADPDEIVASVSNPANEVEEEVVPADLTSVEVEKKGKKEEEGTEEAK